MILPSGVQTLTHYGASSDSKAALLSFSFSTLIGSLDWALGHLVSSHLGTKVSYGFDIELSLDGAHLS